MEAIEHTALEWVYWSNHNARGGSIHRIQLVFALCPCKTFLDDKNNKMP